MNIYVNRYIKVKYLELYATNDKASISNSPQTGVLDSVVRMIDT